MTLKVKNKDDLNYRSHFLKTAPVALKWKLSRASHI